MADSEQLSKYLRKVTGELRSARHSLQARDLREREPIAIVGMSCRLPGGVASPEQLWELVSSGRDGVSGLPADREWDLESLYDPDPDHPTATYVREGGFLQGAADFDAEFFSIGPREALGMDPQQRLLLESAWEALEDARIDPSSLRGSTTGVFAGVMYHDYGRESIGETGFQGVDSVGSLVTGRVSYTLGLEGPAVSIDTACSSSLVAMHLAAQALRGGECELALAGGVAVMGTPAVLIELSRQRGLAPDGRSKSFAAAADGAGWGEGVGLLVLERLSDAQRNGHRVLATIRGSATNQDGASNGITAPNGPSQERVIRQALVNAGLAPAEVDAVEAHGTGTTLGDPIEARALLATYGQGREGNPLRVGSLKSNIGHAQAAAGVAGVIKTVMAMRHGVLPPTLHIDEPTPEVDWSAGEVELLTEAQEWEPNGRPRRAGVSSFGVSGTNAHVILEEAPELTPPDPSESESEPESEPEPAEPATPLAAVPLLLSAKTPEALRAQASRLASHLQANPELAPLDVAHSLASSRAAFERRAAVVGADREELLAGLEALRRGEPHPSVTEGLASPGRNAFVFSGQGSQWQGMALELMEASPTFSRRMHECLEAVSPHMDWSPLEVLEGVPGAPTIKRVDAVQPLLFSVAVSLSELWRSFGVKPEAVIGHSQGEIAAACVCGGLSLEDAARVVSLRSQMITRLVGQGATIAVGLSAEQAEERLKRWDGAALAAVNGPSSVGVAGPPESIAGLAEECRRDGIRVKEIPGSLPAHSPSVEILREDILEALAPIQPRSAEIPFYSTVTAGPIDTATLDAHYWYRNTREPVRFAETTRALLADGYTTFVEPSANPLLTMAIGEIAEAEVANPETVAALGSLRREEGGMGRFTLSLATAHAHGAKVDWEAIFAPQNPSQVDLPTYPFQRRRYWMEPIPFKGDASAIGQTPTDHPLLAAVATVAGEEQVLLSGAISLKSHPWLADHVVHGTPILPGTASVELALTAGAAVGAETIAELTIEAPLVLPDEGSLALQVKIGPPGEGGRREIEIHSRASDDGEWERNAAGVLSSAEQADPEPTGLDQWPPPGAEPVDVDFFYRHMAEIGVDYGPAFQGIKRAWKGGGELFAEAELSERELGEAGKFAVHPALLDAALHLCLLGVEETPSTKPAAPFSWSEVKVHRAGSTLLRTRLRPVDDRAELTIADETGARVVSIDSIATRSVEASQLATNAAANFLYELRWQEAPSPEGGAAETQFELFECESDPDLDPAAAAQELCARALAALQEAIAEDRHLAFLTRGAQVLAAGESPDPAAAAVWGLVRSAQAEHPGRFVLVDGDGSEASREALSTALTIGEPQLALREGAVTVPRLARARVEPTLSPPDPEATVLITGGLSGIGAKVARHLAENGSRHLLLVSRRGPEAEGAEELRAELAELGAEVRIAACDVSDREALEELIGAVDPEHPLGAVVHAAAGFDNGLINSLDPERLQRALAPKAGAAWHLHELTREMELSQFVLFSSLAGTFTNPGQGNYAAANAFLDGLASRRQAEGLVATTIAWGLWERGKAGGDERLGDTDEARLAREGILAMPAEQGLELFDRVTASGVPFLAAVSFENASLRALARDGALSPILSGLVRVTAGRSRGEQGALAARLAAAAEEEREGLVLDLVRAQAAAVLGHASGEAVAPERAFKDAGFDSLGAVELRDRLTQVSGMQLPATLVFDYPNPAALATFLRQQAEGAARSTAAAVRAPARAEEPIAIVGMSCRFPGGVASPEQLWELVSSGRDAVSGFPEDRGWDLERLYDPDPENPGTVYTREGGFLERAPDFDAAFFGISPREALGMDPQQRLLLEAAWEALEEGGIDPASLGGSDTGVFAGVMAHDYGHGLDGTMEAEGFRPTASSSIVSGRVSYTLGLEGPAVSVDTACSSSLVAIHLAAQALRGGECGLALAGGVAVMVTPGMLIDFSHKRGLSVDGRCKSFAATADGTGCSEGVGLLVLERLSDARRNGHRVLATMRGSATNQDGASNGLTAPNGPSQERVIRQALANAGLSPSEVDAVEAHGTGTTLGDPIEAQAILATYGQEREGNPLRLGSLKSNIGHAQAAAGVAGVIKTVMAMRHGVLPQTLHVDEPTPEVDWSAGEVELLTEAMPWESNGQPRRAGVSAFGLTGTNAHVILEEAGEEAAAEQPQPAEPLPVTPLLLSAKAPEALAEQASRLASHLETNPELDAVDVAHSLATSRAALEHRAAVVGADREELLAALQALGAGEPHPSIRQDRAKNGKTAFMLTGQGAQRAGMGRELYDSFPTYAQTLDELCAEIDPQLGFSLRERLFAEEGTKEAESLNRTELTQPALFATEVSLYRLVESWGLRPDFLIGHSIGELAAAHIAGVLSLPGACKLVCARGELMGALPEGGAMVAIEATEEEIATELPEGLSIAAINDPGSVVVSGEERAALDLLEAWKEKGRKATRLKVSHAFHSELMEPMLVEFTAVAESLTFDEPRIPIVSNLTGEILTAEQATSPDYWASQVRGAVRFADGISHLSSRGVCAFLELGPDGVLCAMAQGSLGDQETLLAPLLRKERPEAATLLGAMGAAYAHGAKVEWQSLFAPQNPQRVDLPTYPFQRRRYWLEPAALKGDATSIGQEPTDHPILTATTSLAGEEQTLLSGSLSLKSHPWLTDHVVHGAAILPGTAFLELALRAGEEVGSPRIAELTIEAPLVLPAEGSLALQVKVGAEDEEGQRSVEIHSRLQGDEAGEWVRNASGLLSSETPASQTRLDQWPPQGAEPLSPQDVYDAAATLGVDYGPAFQGLDSAWRDGEELFAEIHSPEELGETAGYGIHPALLDSTMHVAHSENGEEGEGPAIPFSWQGVQLHATGASSLRVRFKAGEQAELTIADETGAPVISVEALATRRIDPSQLAQVSTASDSLFEIEWKSLALPEEPEASEASELFEATPDPDLGPAQAAEELCACALTALQEAIAEDRSLAFLTRGAMAIAEDESPDPAATALWGLVRSAQAEHPGRFTLLDSDQSLASGEALAAALSSEEPQLALREGSLSAPRLVRAKAEEGEERALDPEATVLITGGLTGLGALVARHLAEQGSRHLLLVSRRGIETEGAQELRAELTDLGAETEIAACDVSDREALETLLDSIPSDHPLGALIHCAGVIDDGVIESLDPERLAKVFAPKATAAQHLHELTRDLDLSHFVLFSSVAATIGNPGQGNYAAANSFLDGLALKRRSEGLAAISLGWGAMELAGEMAATMREADRARLSRSGISTLSPEQGLAHLDRALSTGLPQLLPVAFNRGALRAAARAELLPPLFAALAPAPARREAGGGESLAQRLAGVPEADWEKTILALVRDHVAIVLGHPSGDAVDPEAAFKDLGFDSLAAVELRNRLSGATGMQLPATLVFDYPTTVAVAGHIRDEVATGGGGSGDSVDEQIDKLAAMLEALESDRRAVADGRLRALLASADRAGAEDDAVARIQSASAEEILEIVNEEIGTR